MGLDTVELVMDIEEAFQVRIPDADAEKQVSIGDTVDWLMRELQRRGRPATTTGCNHRTHFRRLRDELIASGAPPRALRPRAAVAQVVTSSPVIAAWPRILKRLELPQDPRRPHRRHTSRYIGVFGPVAYGDATLGDLSRRLALSGDPGSLWVNNQLSRDRVRRLLLDIVARQTGVHPDRLSESTRYIQDLHMD